MDNLARASDAFRMGADLAIWCLPKGEPALNRVMSFLKDELGITAVRFQRIFNEYFPDTPLNRKVARHILLYLITMGFEVLISLIVAGSRARAFSRSDDIGDVEMDRWALGRYGDVYRFLDVQDASDIVDFFAEARYAFPARARSSPLLTFELFNGAEAWQDTTHGWGIVPSVHKERYENAVMLERFYSAMLSGKIRRELRDGAFLNLWERDEKSGFVPPLRMHFYVWANEETVGATPVHDHTLAECYHMGTTIGRFRKSQPGMLDVPEAGVARNHKVYPNPIETDRLPAWTNLFDSIEREGKKRGLKVRRVFLHSIVDPRAKELTFDVSDNRVLDLWFNEEFYRKEVVARKGISYFAQWVTDKRWCSLVKSRSERFAKLYEADEGKSPATKT